MYRTPSTRTWATLVCSVVLCLFVYCHTDTTANHADEPPALPYLNLADTVAYVGMEPCRACHADKYETFVQTGMGMSFDAATHQKSAAQFGKHVAVYDTAANMYYHPFWRRDSLFIQEYRLQGKDTTHQRTEYIRYIIGSGQHTNSHLFEENGFVYQAPITFYTQQGIWDLAPGFGGGFSSRFNRIIGQECMACHNAKARFTDGSENQFTNLPHGINCERCHGAGGEHVRRKLAGEVIDTSQQIDYSIVNPARLPNRDYQMSVCQRCHLQGIAVLKNDRKDFESFKPGMLLRQLMDVYLPEYDGNETKFIMASQAHRLTKSQCYMQSATMTCLTCHNPHVSVKHTPRQQFNNACNRCHTQHTCSLPMAQRKVQSNDCSECHMPPSPSIDIPHVTVHDHYIRKPIAAADRQKVEKFVRLVAANNPQPTALSQAKGYLHYFESYTSGNNPTLLDSAAYYTQQAAQQLDQYQLLDTRIHLLYLQQQYAQITKAAAAVAVPNIKTAWTAYRIGEAYSQLQQTNKAVAYLERAVELMPLQHDFNNKLAAAYIAQNQLDKAQAILQTVTQQNTRHVSAWTNLGFVYARQGNVLLAQQCYQRALALNPDHATALLNYAALQISLQNKADARQLLQHLLTIDPQNAQARAALQGI